MTLLDRDRRVDALLAEGLAEAELSGRWLVAGRLPLAERELTEAQVTWDGWHRFAVPDGPPPTPLPPGSGYDGAVLRLPRGADAADMALHLIAARLAPHGELWVAGANDEGIRSVPRRLNELMEQVMDPVPGGHARRVRSARPRVPVRAGSLEDWLAVDPLELPTRPGPRQWATFPGVFAAGRVDPATELLLQHLPDPAGRRVLDFGCGSGVIAAVLAERGAVVEACDHDVLAAEAARRNVGPQVVVTCGPGLPVGSTRWDWVVSNPPIHAGQERDLSVIRSLAAALPERLSPGGQVFWVTQVTVPLQELVAATLPRSAVIAANRSFKVVRSSR